MFGIPNPMYDFLLVPGFLIGVGWLLRGLFERWSGAVAVYAGGNVGAVVFAGLAKPSSWCPCVVAGSVMSLVHGYLVGDVRALREDDGTRLVEVESPFGVIFVDADMWLRAMSRVES